MREAFLAFISFVLGFFLFSKEEIKVSTSTESDIQLGCGNWCSATDFSENALTPGICPSPGGLVVPSFATLLNVHPPLKCYVVGI